MRYRYLVYAAIAAFCAAGLLLFEDMDLGLPVINAIIWPIALLLVLLLLLRRTPNRRRRRRSRSSSRSSSTHRLSASGAARHLRLPGSPRLQRTSEHNSNER